MQTSNLLPRLCFCLTLTILSGCTTLAKVHPLHQTETSTVNTAFVKEVQSAILRSGVNDNSSMRVKGFPYLRSNRMLSTFKDEPLNQQQINDWTSQMHQLALDSVKKEIQNLPDEALAKINASVNKKLSRQQVFERTQREYQNLLKQLQSDPELLNQLRDNVKDISQYSRLQKIVGFYPIFYVPTYRASMRAYDKFRDWHKKSFEDHEPIGQMTSFNLANVQRLSPDQLRRLYQSVKIDSLGLPQPDERQTRQLLQAYAPIIYQDIDQDFDRFGEVYWNDGTVTINPNRPVVYHFLSYGLIEDQPVLQLNYSFWYEGRLGPNAPRLERGELDGMTIRVSLDQNGLPVMVDTTNNCGCYQFFIPNADIIASVQEKRGLDPLVVTYLPEEFPRYPLAYKMNTGWHQIIRVKADNNPSHAKTYTMLDYAELESLPHSDGRYESVFDKKGIMKDSYRIEPFLFFPSGVSKVGYMRQRNNQPIKLIGEEHFSNPNLFNNSFIFK